MKTGLEAWKAKYYPVDAAVKMTKRQAVEHSLLKWKGLRLNVLAEFGLHKESKNIVENEPSFSRLSITTHSCALCLRYMGASCKKCPLAAHLGKPCDAFGGPYIDFSKYGNPEPMIKALEATKRKLPKLKVKE